jgi:hypothetical protein
MVVSEILGLQDYFQDARFQAKKPNLRGTWQERCGDNFYSRGPDGNWVRHRNRFHLDDQVEKRDTKFARVFIGHQFWYRGRSAKAAPSRFAPLAGGRGARVNHDPGLTEEFRDWVGREFQSGVADTPNDNPDLNGARRK